MLHMLGGLAEFKRSLILQRCNEGRARAKADGIVFGRKPKLTTHQRREELKIEAAQRSARPAARSR